MGGKEKGCWRGVPGLMGCPGRTVLVLREAPGQQSHGSKRMLVPIAGAFDRSLSHPGSF